MKNYFLSGVMVLSLLIPAVSLAQSSDVDTSGDTACAIISVNLRYGARDASTGGAVSILQDFLNSRGYLSVQPTGFFGSMTRAAVASFQNANGISATPPGFVGPVTRAKIQAIDCNNDTSITPPTVNSTQPPVTTNPIQPTPTTNNQTSLNITNPLGGHLWTVGDTQTFQWTTLGITSNVTGYIDLVNNYGSIYRIYNVPNTGSYTWNPVGTVNGSSIPTGTYSVKIIMNGFGDIEGPLTIAGSAPTISNITPSQGSANTSATIYGTNLSSASSVQFFNSAGQNVASLSSPSVSSVTSTSLIFTLSGAFAYNVNPGTYQVKVVTPSGTSNAGTFTLTAPSNSAPTITTVSPNQGSANTTATIYGTNLSGATSVQFYNSSGQMVASLSSPSISSISTSVGFTIGGAFAYNVDPGTYQVKVVTSNGTSNGLSFTLTAPAASNPTITNISPSQGGANDVITIYGTNLSGVSSVVFYSNNQQSASLSSQSINLQDQNHLTFTISPVLAANEPAGTYQIKVVSPSGTSNTTNFTMNSWSTSQPTISSISPSQGSNGASVTIYGSNLSGASSVMFYDSSNQNVASISSPSISSVTSNSLVFTISGAFAYNVAPGTYQVKVSTPLGTTNAGSFTLIAP